MRGFVLLTVMAVAVNARPEIPSGYNYVSPIAPNTGSGYDTQIQTAYGPPATNSGHAPNINTAYGPPTGGYNPNINTYQPKPQQIIEKFIYVHVPPPEDEQAINHQQHSPAVARKRYKIIFIKAPSYPSNSQQFVPQQAQNEEKTLVYVLVKKPDDAVVPFGADSVSTVPVSKPEVYFIKYKAQKDAGGYAGSDKASDVNISYQPPAPVPASSYGIPLHK